MTIKKRLFERQLKAKLLRYNPWFKDRAASIRLELGIPMGGFKSFREAARNITYNILHDKLAKILVPYYLVARYDVLCSEVILA